MTNNKQANKFPEVAFFPTKAGDKSRVLVTPAVYDQIQKIEVGSALLITAVPTEQREKAEANGKTAPTHRLVVLPKNNDQFKRDAGNAAYRANYAKSQATKAAKSEL